MQNHVINIESEPSLSFMAEKAANSVSLNLTEKLRFTLNVQADIETPYSVGLIVGNSGSGKTRLAQEIWGDGFDKPILDLSKTVIDQFPEDSSYEDRTRALCGMGLTQVPCWVRPAVTLSNGQRARAEAALRLASEADPIVIDEWTSVVDRTVAKIMSHCVQKEARRTGRSIVVLSCHYDVIEWLQPDWIIDCTTQTYEDRRVKKKNERNNSRSPSENAIALHGKVLASITI